MIRTANRKIIGVCLWITACALAGIPVGRACSWSYILWNIRSKTADPLFRFIESGKVGYVDASGTVVIPPSLPATRDNFDGEFHEGLLGIKEVGGYRYLDRAGNTVFHTDAWLAFDFHEGFAVAGRYAGFHSDQFPKYGFLDRTGSFAIAAQYRSVESFSDGLATVAVSSEFGSTGYINSKGVFVIPPTLTYGSSFSEDRAAVIVGGPCRMVNPGSCGRPMFEPTESGATYDCRYAFIDKRGQPISRLRFDDADSYSEGLAAVKIGNAWGFVDHSGNISIPAMYSYVGEFSEGLAWAMESGKAGFIDHSGRFVIPPQFANAGNFSDGRALVWTYDGSGKRTYRFIDKTGKPAFPGEFSAADSFSHGLAPIALDQKGALAWIDTSGRRVLTYAER